MIIIRKQLQLSVCIYLTPSHDQGVTQGQFLSWIQLVWSFPSLSLVALPRLKTESVELFTHSSLENSWNHISPTGAWLVGWFVDRFLNKSWRQHPTRHQLYGHLPPITKTIQVRRTRHAGHCWRSRDELIRDVLLWTPTHGRAQAGRPARTYIQQLCEDTGCLSWGPA